MTLEEIKNMIEKNVPESTAHIFDPMNDGQHLQAVVISPAFEGILLVKQHQMVMNPLKDILAKDIVHALGLKTMTPGQWLLEKDKYGF